MAGCPLTSHLRGLVSEDEEPRHYALERLMVSQRSGELTSYGELILEERRRGDGPSDGDPHFSEMGPDVMLGTNVVDV